MRRTASILLAGALAVAALATTEGEDLSAHPCYDEATETLVFPEQQVWFHEGESKLGNAAATPNPFDTTAPAASVTDGAGAGQYGAAATSTSGTEAYGAVETTFSGTFTGCLDTILLDIYSFDPTSRTSTGAATAGNPAEPQQHQANVRITIDGFDVQTGQIVLNSDLANEGFGPNLNRLGFSVGSTMEQLTNFGIELDGEHTIEIGITPWFANTGHAVYVWDTTEVPSGLTFNGAITEDYVAEG